MNTQELFAAIEEGLHEHNDYADGQTPYHNYRKSGLEALETLRQRVADLEIELDEHKRFTDWLNRTYDFANGFTDGVFPGAFGIERRLRELYPVEDNDE